MFGVVEQSAATLFTGTIAENIEYGKVSLIIFRLFCHISDS
jgi:ABC-type multidrug transport system fused ATPase/permease subunit